MGTGTEEATRREANGAGCGFLKRFYESQRGRTEGGWVRDFRGGLAVFDRKKVPIPELNFF